MPLHLIVQELDSDPWICYPWVSVAQMAAQRAWGHPACLVAAGLVRAVSLSSKKSSLLFQPLRFAFCWSEVLTCGQACNSRDIKELSVGSGKKIVIVRGTLDLFQLPSLVYFLALLSSWAVQDAQDIQEHTRLAHLAGR